jgi:hypothetical protein
MLRDDAVARINNTLGWRPVGHSLTDAIVARLKEAQRDLEHGKTLPKFLLQEDQDLVLTAGSSSLPLPTGFLRIDDDNLPHFFLPGNNVTPIYLMKMNYSDAVKRLSFNFGGQPTAFMTMRAPPFVIRKSTIDFIVPAQSTINLKWNYYKGAMLLDTNVTNFWLDETNGAPEWLIGEAGYRMAMDTRDKDAKDIFDDMRTRARASCLGHQFIEEESGGPFVMGAKN